MSETLLSLLEARAGAPEAAGYTFLHGVTAATLTYGDLLTRSTAMAARLQRQGAGGERVINACPPGLDFIVALFGCIAAGSVVVPMPPPTGSRSGDTVRKLVAVRDDVRAVCVLTTAAVVAIVRRHFPELLERGAPLVAVDEWGPADRPSWTRPRWRPADTVFIQYTSGSTSEPKGVQLSHRHLLHNSATIHRRFGHDQTSRGCIWLPPYHDMGLIGGILQPLYGAFPVTLMHPRSFVQRPVQWLRAISDSRATTSGGPNFAYQLCVDRIGPDDRATLDLSSWTVAFSGSEPLSAATIEGFIEAFGPSGFSPDALYPCYGLAEATLFVSGGSRGSGPDVRRFDNDRLATGRVAEIAAPGVVARRVVSCGMAGPDGHIVIVDPDSRVPCNEGCVGEIWFSGESAAERYWERPHESAELLGACLPGSGRRYIRTGDLGFLIGDSLFVTGRAKDMLIVSGRNIFAQDLERTSEASHSAFVAAGAAAFTLDLTAGERIVVAQEVRARHVPPKELGAAIRRAIAREHSVRVHEVVLLPPGRLLRTASGKVRRGACREGLLNGTIEVLARV